MKFDLFNINIALVVLIAITSSVIGAAVHEGIHAYQAKHINAKIDEICFLGYIPADDGKITQSGVGWVTFEKNKELDEILPVTIGSIVTLLLAILFMISYLRSESKLKEV
jgi:hypothetical protein